MSSELTPDPGTAAPSDALEARAERLRFRDWRFRVRDMLASVRACLAYTEGMSFEEFVADRRTRDAVLHNLAVLGEAVRWVPGPVKQRHPAVPWATLRGVRNVVVHEYFGVDDRILWDTVTHDLPALASRLETVLATAG